MKILGVGEFAVTATKGESLRTYALGSCVGVVALDPVHRAVGMVHVALPQSATHPGRAKENPGYFADTGIAALIDAMASVGSHPAGEGLIFKIASGARILDLHNGFEIGRKNRLDVRRALWRRGLVARAQDLGGRQSRSLEATVDSGKVTVTSAGRESWEI